MTDGAEMQEVKVTERFFGAFLMAEAGELVSVIIVGDGMDYDLADVRLFVNDTLSMERKVVKITKAEGDGMLSYDDMSVGIMLEKATKANLYALHGFKSIDDTDEVTILYVSR